MSPYFLPKVMKSKLLWLKKRVNEQIFWRVLLFSSPFLKKNWIVVHFFYKNQIILAEPQCSYCSSKFWAHLLLFCSCDNYNFWPCITHMYIYHPHGEFLADFGWFEGNILYFNTQIRVYHIFLTEGTTDYVAAGVLMA